MTVLAISIFAYPMAKAQTSIEENPVVRDALDSMFENLDKTKVPTGLLLDYAVDMVDLSYYDGTELTDENYVDNILLDDILRSIRSAAVLTLPPTRGGIPDDALSLTWPWITSHSVDMSIAAYKYNYIKTNAIEDGLINYNSVNNKVSTHTRTESGRIRTGKRKSSPFLQVQTSARQEISHSNFLLQESSRT